MRKRRRIGNQRGSMLIEKGRIIVAVNDELMSGSVWHRVIVILIVCELAKIPNE